MESSGPPRDTARAMSKENVESFKRATELLNRRDIGSFLEMLDPGVEWHPALVTLLEGEATVYRGREEVRALLQDIFEAFADFRFEFSEIRDLGDRILAVGEMRGAWHGKWCRDRVAVGLPHPIQERQGNPSSGLPRSQAGPRSRRALGVALWTRGGSSD